MPSKDLALALPNEEGTVWIGKTRVVASYAGDRWIVAYDFGAIVFVNRSGVNLDRFIDRMLAAASRL